MDTKEYLQKKEKVAQIVLGITKNEWAIAEIMKRLKDEFKITSLDELDERIDEVDAMLKEKINDKNTLEIKLEGMIDWDSL